MEVKGCGQDLKTRCGYLLYAVQTWLDFAAPQGVGKGWQGASFFPSQFKQELKLFTSWNWRNSGSISKCIKIWEGGAVEKWGFVRFA